MTYEQALVRMRAAKQIEDTEAAHLEADEILCQYLRELGATELVDLWNEIDKWYAWQIKEIKP